MGTRFSQVKPSLAPLIESSEGLHLTIYLENLGDLIDLKLKIAEILDEARDTLEPILNQAELRKFVAPIDSLLINSELLDQVPKNLGIFRTKDSFRLISLPIEVKTQLHIATSFHVKPLLKWMQVERDFYFVGVNRLFATLYMSNQTLVQRIDSISTSEFKNFADEWLTERVPNSRSRIFVAGDAKVVKPLLRKNLHRPLVKPPLAWRFSEDQLAELIFEARQLMQAEARKKIERSFFEYRCAESMNLAKKNIFQIAKAAIQGRIRKLIVADGIQIFGKVDKTTGGLAIHPTDLDHEDDDILDDLAQAVLLSGGEVVVASREEIPQGRPALAILDTESDAMSLEISEKEDLGKERVGV